MNFKRFLYTVSGDDYGIIIKCDKLIQHRFIFIGIFVTAIFLLCFFSLYWTIDSLFHNNIIGTAVSIFISWMIVNIYLLLLYTLSKNLLPHKKSNKEFNASILIRLIFIVFIAIIISKPLEVIMFSNIANQNINLKLDLEDYKQNELKKYNESISSHYNSEIEKLNESIKQNLNLHSTPDIDFIKLNQNKIILLEEEKKAYSNKMTKLLYQSNYFVRSIIILNTKYKFCWIITLLIIFIFLFPAYLKNTLPDDSEFYKQKKYIENKIIQEEYSLFKASYIELINAFLIRNIQYPKNELEKSFKETLVNTHNSKIYNIQFSEPFIDAPFNTIRKRDEREFLKEDDLISDLYNA